MDRIWPRALTTPHVELGVPLDVGLAVLRSTGAAVREEMERDERSYRIDLPNYAMAIYDRAGVVSAVWYGDSAGQLTPFGKSRKLKLYMQRFTKNGKWDYRMNNGWMKYYFNDIDRVGLVYGIHMDVIRINSLSADDAA